MNKAMVYDGHTLKTETWEKDSYEFIKTHVGRYIELVPNEILEKKGIDLWCNEEGKLIDGLQPTLCLTCNGKPYDILNGNLVFTRVKDGETISLTDDDIKFITDLFDNTTFVMTKDYKVLKCLSYGKEV